MNRVGIVRKGDGVFCFFSLDKGDNSIENVFRGCRKMKRSLILVFLWVLIPFFCFAATKAKNNMLNVSFGESKSVAIKYYWDSEKTKEIQDLSKKYSMEAGSTIYVKYDYSKSIKLFGFRIVEYDGLGNRIRFYTLTSQGEIILPDYEDVLEEEIAIEPLCSYVDTIISLSDTCDGIEINGNWVINQNSYHAPSAELNPTIQYTVSYNYDSNKYYLQQVSPEEEAILASSDGKVIFMAREPFDETNPSNYSVQLKPFCHFQIDKKNQKKIESIKDSQGIIEVNDLVEKSFKNGESIIIEIEKSYEVASNYAKVEFLSLEDETRTYAVKIPENNLVYQIPIAIEERKTEDVCVSVDDTRKNKDHELFVIQKGSDRWTEKDFERTEGTRIIEVSDGEQLCVEFNKQPTGNEHIRYKVFSDEGGWVTEDITLSNWSKDKQYLYGFESVSQVLFELSSGLLVTLPNQTESTKVSFYDENGNKLQPGDFLSVGDKVRIFVDDCPVDKELSFYDIKEHLSKGSSKEITIEEETNISLWSYEVIDKPGFWLNPEDYKDSNGQFVFSNENKKTIESPVFFENGSKIYVSGILPTPGYQLPEATIEVKGDFTKNELVKLKFVDLKKTYTLILSQPEYGGKVVYKDKEGKELNEEKYSGIEGDTVFLELKPNEGWKENPIFPTKYSLDPIRDCKPIDFSDAFIEDEGHKPKVSFYKLGAKLTVSRQKRAGDASNFIVKIGDGSEKQKISETVQNLFKVPSKVNGLSEIAVGTGNPLIVSFDGILTGKQALRIKLKQTFKKNDVQEKFYFFTNNSNLKFVHEFSEPIPTSIDITVELLDDCDEIIRLVDVSGYKKLEFRLNGVLLDKTITSIICTKNDSLEITFETKDGKEKRISKKIKSLKANSGVIDLTSFGIGS